MREIILHMVNTHEGLKGVDLALKVMGEINPVVFKYEDYLPILRELVRSGEVIELEYVLPDSGNTHYFPKHIYFPKGTEIVLDFTDVLKENRIHERRSSEDGGV